MSNLYALLPIDRGLRLKTNMVTIYMGGYPIINLLKEETKLLSWENYSMIEKETKLERKQNMFC